MCELSAQSIAAMGGIVMFDKRPDFRAEFAMGYTVFPISMCSTQFGH